MILLIEKKRKGFQEYGRERDVLRAWNAFERVLDQFIADEVQNQNNPSKALKTAVSIVLANLDSWQMLKPVIGDLSSHSKITRILNTSYNSIMADAK